MERIISDREYARWLERTTPTLEFVDAHLKRRRTALDVGAAEGLITRWLADRFALVHAFEPGHKSFVLLQQLDMPGKVVCHNVAVGDKAGKLTLQRDSADADSEHSWYLVNEPGDTTVQTIDALVIPDVDFIKIDVEGYETRVLAGAIETVRVYNPMVMWERATKSWRTRYNDEKPTKLLQRMGYVVAFKGPLDTVMVHKEVS